MKPPEERLVTLSVRVPHKSLELLQRVIEGEVAFLKTRRLPTHGVNRSTAFRTIWEMGELEYTLQRVTLWVTRRVNRYTLAQSAAILDWEERALEDMLRERGVLVPPASRPQSPPSGDGPP